MNPLQFVKNLYDPAYMQGLIHSGGVPLIAAIVFAETGLLVGFFLPGDTMLFLAGVAAATTGPSGQTWLDVRLLVPALIVAAIVGDQVVAKFVPVVRTFVPFMAGVGEMKYAKYLLVDCLAVVFWICLVVLVGYALGTNPFTQKYLDKILIGIALVSMAPMGIGILREFLASRKSAN